MLTWIGHQVVQARINIDFLSSEKSRRDAHLAAAEKQFSTIELESSIKALTSCIECYAEEMMGQRIEKAKRDIGDISKSLAESERIQSLLERNFDEEIDELTREIGDLRVSISLMYDEKNDAHDIFKKSSANIDRWYSRSKSYGGGRGRKIPQWSLTMPSKSDLNYEKERKRKASQTIAETAAEIACMKEHLGDLRSKTDLTFADRRECRGLIARGASRDVVGKQICELKIRQKNANRILSGLLNDRATLVRRMASEKGIDDLRGQIIRRNAEREEFLALFDSKDVCEQRRAAHELEWRNNHASKRGRC